MSSSWKVKTNFALKVNVQDEGEICHLKGLIHAVISNMSLFPALRPDLAYLPPQTICRFDDIICKHQLLTTIGQLKYNNSISANNSAIQRSFPYAVPKCEVYNERLKKKYTYLPLYDVVPSGPSRRHAGAAR